MDKCIFCDIVSGEAEASIVYRDDVVAVFMDIQPINPGHVLIIPNVHAACLSELPEDCGAHMFRMAQRMAAGIRRSGVRCEGINLFLADGAAAMQEVFHTHLHVVPRFEGDGFGLRFSEQYFARPPRAELEAAAEMIRKQISDG